MFTRANQSTTKTHYFIPGSIPNLNNIVDVPPPSSLSEPRHSFVDKIHGLTDKLQALSHIGHEAGDTKGKSGNLCFHFTCKLH